MLHQAWHVFGWPDIDNLHAIELGARIPVLEDCCVVDLQETQSLKVACPHRQRIVGKQQTKLGANVAKLLLDMLPTRDVSNEKPMGVHGLRTAQDQAEYRRGRQRTDQQASKQDEAGSLLIDTRRKGR